MVATAHEVHFQAVQVLGGKEYVDRVVAAFAGTKVRVEFPLAGLRIGEALHVVQEAVDSGLLLIAGTR